MGESNDFFTGTSQGILLTGMKKDPTVLDMCRVCYCLINDIRASATPTAFGYLVPLVKIALRRGTFELFFPDGLCRLCRQFFF